MPKRHDPAALAHDIHHTVQWVAERLGISKASVRSLFKSDERVRYLPQAPGRGAKRRTMLIPDTVYRETYATAFCY